MLIYTLFCRCAQKIVTQLETVPLLSRNNNYSRSDYRYSKLFQEDPDLVQPSTSGNRDKGKKWWTDRKWKDRSKTEEKEDNTKNERMEKEMELNETKAAPLKTEKKSVK